MPRIRVWAALRAQRAWPTRTGSFSRVTPKVSRTPPQVEKLAQALGKYLGGFVKLEFVEAPANVETPTQTGERRSAEALDAARRSLEEDPMVRELKSRFGATLHPESVRPTEQ